MSAPDVPAGPAGVAAVPAFDTLAAHVVPGAHLVVRHPGVILVLAVDASTRAATAEPLLQLVAEASARTARAPGRDLARRLTAWLVDQPEAPAFGTVAATDTGLAVFLSGAVTYRAPGSAELAGRDAGFAVDRLVGWPTGFSLAVDAVDATTLAAPGPLDGLGGGLLGGSVPGAGVRCTLAAAAAPPDPPARADGPVAEPAARSAPDLTKAPAPAVPAPPTTGSPSVAPPPVETGPLAPPPAPEVSARILGVAPDEAPRPALPVPGPTTPHTHPPAPARPTRGEVPEPGGVAGYRCSRGHLNDPRVAFCSGCGIRMDQLTGVLVRGRRPPLGLLVLDSGTTFVLDDDYLLGREPSADEGVRAGRLRPVPVEDSSGTLSRVHAEIRLVEWDVVVVDRGSANGTFVAVPGAPAWTALVPHQPHVLVAGTHLRVGHRTFTYASPHGSL